MYGELLAGYGGDNNLAGIWNETRLINNNLAVTGQLGSALAEYGRKYDEETQRSTLNSYAEIRKRLSQAIANRHIREHYPVDKAAQSVNALGQTVTADGLSKAGEASGVCRSEDTQNSSGRSGSQAQSTPGTTDHGKNGKPTGKGEQTASKDPVKFDGSPEENAKALFELFNRIKLTTTGVQAIAYVNPLTSRNLGAPPNQIYTIYTQRPTGNVYQEETGWVREETKKERYGDEEPNNPHEPLSVFALWEQSPLIDPDKIDQIFNRHAVDIEMFEQYKKFAEEQNNISDKMGTTSPIVPYTLDNAPQPPAANGSDDATPHPPLKSAQNAKPFTAVNVDSLMMLGTESCRFDAPTQRNYLGVGSRVNRSAAQTAKSKGKSNGQILIEAAQRRNFPPAVLLGLAWQESKFDPAARAKKSSATGLVQLIDETFRAYAGIKNPDATNPYHNAEAALNLLEYILKRNDNDIFFTIGAYHDGHNLRIKGGAAPRVYNSTLARNHIKKTMCIAKLMLLYDHNPPLGASTTFDFRKDIHLITALGFTANGAKFYLPLAGTTELSQEDEYGLEKYGIFVDNANTYRNVDRTDMSELFAWLSLQYNTELTKEMLGKVFAHMDETPTKKDVGVDKSIEGAAGTVKTEKQETMGIGNEMVEKSEDGKSNTVKPGSSIHEELVNNYAQYLSAHWFDPVVVPPNVYPDTSHMTTEELNKFYKFVRKRLAMNGTPTRIGNDRVPLQVLKALAEGGNEAYQIAFAARAATGQEPPPREQYESPQARNWIAEATISEINRNLVNATLVDMLEFRLRPDKSSWPSYNSMALYMAEHPNDLGKVISPSLALDMALYSAYNPVKHLISPEEALKLRSYYSHGYYPFTRYYGDDTTPVGEEPNRITEQVVLDKTINYIRDPKFYEFMETGSGDDLIRQIPRYTGTESYIAYRRLKESQNRRRLLIAWAGSSVANGYSTDTGYDNTSIGMEERISRTGTEAAPGGKLQ